MSVVRKTSRVSPLAAKMSQPGGRTVEEALTKAAAGLASHHDEAMATIRQRLARLEFLSAERAADSTREVYAVAEAMLDLAGFFETGPLHPAVTSLCDITDHMLHEGRWTWEAVTLHVTALRLILDGGCRNDDMAATLLEGLSRLSSHLRQERAGKA